MKTAFVALLISALFVGCSHHKHVLAPVPEATALQRKAANFLNAAQDQVDLYRKDEKAARYEQVEIAKVQADLDEFDLSVPDALLQAEVNNLVTDLEAMAAKDDVVYRQYIL